MIALHLSRPKICLFYTNYSQPVNDGLQLVWHLSLRLCNGAVMCCTTTPRSSPPHSCVQFQLCGLEIAPISSNRRPPSMWRPPATVEGIASGRGGVPLFLPAANGGENGSSDRRCAEWECAIEEKRGVREIFSLRYRSNIKA